MEDTPQKALQDIKAFPRSRYEALDLTGLAAFAVHWLHEQQIPTSFENIVVTTFKMFPAKFALEGYPEHPDAARINRTLLQLRPKYRNWARGTVQKGFVLTDSGMRKVAEVQKILAGGASARSKPTQNTGSLPRTMDLSGELRLIEGSALFCKWKEGRMDEGTVLELLNMLGAYAYTPPRVLQDRLKSLEQVASQIRRPEITEFLHDVRRAFGERLHESR